MESAQAEIVSLKRKIEDIEAEINEVKAGRGDWSEMPTPERLSYLSNLERTRAGLQEEKILLLKQTSAGTVNLLLNILHLVPYRVTALFSLLLCLLLLRLLLSYFLF